ncbi:DUF4221 family protein [Echinicola sp. CAU 1574]|uniref:DUF4221 family protein n=1 Tax=Echinicola arenosa TaxID=2774144 RepID=A0ABR9ALY7_9BACT|nr:DUF4221 family protein [Echinicola arenosa]MBD8489824.1 DUF4221 family protein [Echinicola arenosa]
MIQWRYVLFFGLTLASCQKSKRATFSRKVEITHVKIPITHMQLNAYPISHAFEEQGTPKLVGYNKPAHALDFFDLEAEKAGEVVPLEKQGPNGIGDIKSIYYHNQDSIFLYEQGKLQIVNLQGRLTQSVDLFELVDVKQYGMPVCNLFFKLNYQAENHALLFTLINRKNPIEGSLVVALDIKNRQVAYLPISHTQVFKDRKGQVGYMRNIGFYGYWQGKILYNFQYASSLFLYDPNGPEPLIQSSGVETAEGETVAMLEDKAPGEAYDQHMLQSTWYFTAIPDPWRNLVYRLEWGAPNPKYAHPNNMEKSMTFSVYDEQLQYLYSYPLPDHTYELNNWFVNKNGLYLNASHPKNTAYSEDFLEFDVLKFE